MRRLHCGYIFGGAYMEHVDTAALVAEAHRSGWLASMQADFNKDSHVVRDASARTHTQRSPPSLRVQCPHACRPMTWLRSAPARGVHGSVEVHLPRTTEEVQAGCSAFLPKARLKTPLFHVHFLMANAALLSTSGTHGRAQRLRLPAKLHFPGPT